MFKSGNKRIVKMLALGLALLLSVPAVPAAAAPRPTAGPSQSALPLEDASQTAALPQESPTPQPEEEPAGEAPSPSETPVASETPAPAETPTPTEAPEGEATPQPSATPEPTEEPSQQGAQLEGTQQETFEAYPLLVTGGHKAYMSGEKGARFYPERAMTRAEMAATLYNLLAAKPPVSESIFSDVKSGDWYYTAVNSLAKAGVLSGRGNGRFDPSDTVTRAEFVAALCKCFQVSPGSSTFSDISGHWAEEQIKSAAAAGWISGLGGGRFGPDEGIKRSQVAALLNNALERTGEGFAADANSQEFVDVPRDYWAFEHIAEAADPVAGDDPVDDPVDDDPPPVTGITVGQTVRVTADGGLWLRQGPGTSYGQLRLLSTGTLLTVTSVEDNGWLGVKTSSGQSGYVSGEYVAPYNGEGSAEGASLSAYSLTLAQYQSARLDGFVESNIEVMRWESSNENVVSPGYAINYGGNSQGAMLYGVSPGTATITFTDGKGAKATCQVTVTAAEPVRSAYGDGNIVARGSSFDLVAVTDASKGEVRFEIADGPANGSYTTTSYDTETAYSSYGLPNNTVRVFRRSVQFGEAGTYTVRAYSRASGGSWSSGYYEFTVQVTSSDVSATTATTDSRRASGEIISILAEYEGYVQEIEDDPLASGNPTVGHGYVVPQNQAFYNNMTKAEAYSFLVNTVNKEGYASAVERMRASYGMKMSQAQFDALTSFVYNCGPGVMSTQFTWFVALLNAVDPSGISSSNPVVGTLNAGDANMFTQPSLDSSVVDTVPNDATVRVTDYRVYRNSKQHEVWYLVTWDGLTGWMPAGYVQLSGSRQHDLTYADSTVLANNILQWNKSGEYTYPGLVYRRLSECKIFFFGDYEEGSPSSSEYRYNNYGFDYPLSAEPYEQRH